ncbi:hypothetical protein K227x_18960 [Rubripirellula lacrimiformis]|uniref:Uncharacterized protein n=1 Tax=Rubripirellula lacrimiformis TaxID=1930273 RepID=A0A517N8S3_9BACT|nr:hypothetical protein K227x_18960 [Rubripirellula lacrimiformis]
MRGPRNVGFATFLPPLPRIPSKWSFDGDLGERVGVRGPRLQSAVTEVPPTIPPTFNLHCSICNLQSFFSAPPHPSPLPHFGHEQNSCPMRGRGGKKRRQLRPFFASSPPATQRTRGGRGLRRGGQETASAPSLLFRLLSPRSAAAAGERIEVRGPRNAGFAIFLPPLPRIPIEVELRWGSGGEGWGEGARNAIGGN